MGELILITNDDGIDAGGVLKLAKALKSAGRARQAPARQQIT